MNKANFQYIPIILEKSPRGDRMFDIFSKLLEERIVFVTGPIHDMMANTVIAQLLYLQSENDKKDISVYINSPGGSAYAGLAIYNHSPHETRYFHHCRRDRRLGRDPSFGRWNQR